MIPFPSLSNLKNAVFSLFFVVIFASCATTQQSSSEREDTQTKADSSEQVQSPYDQERPVPNDIDSEIPNAYKEAIENGTRTESGAPGENYWQQYTHYDMDVELIPEDKKVIGSSTITYENNSPDDLEQLLLEMAQNVHKEGVKRKESTEITGGATIDHISVEGNELSESEQQGQPGYIVDGTLLGILLEEPLESGESITFEVEWSFDVPQQGAGGRMGYSEDNLFYIGYWYPQMHVYDDVMGWMTDPFQLNAEFYHGFADYEVDITAPEQWLVAATGELDNAENVLQEDVYDRRQEAHNTDEIVNVVNEDDFGNITTSGENGKVTWNFSAKKVRDFAFSATTESIWDATRASTGDVDGDGETDYTYIDAIYRDSAPLWEDAAEYSQHSIEFLSDYTGISYPWPHMTAVEGADIIGGGMEFPMMTIIGGYNGQPTQALYSVIAHEIAHMWVPMQVNTNERRYGWIDEGTTTFNENQSKKDIFPDDPNPDTQDFQSYFQIAGTDYEGEIMRWSDFHYNSSAYGVASYPKPASILVALRGLLGEDTFEEAYHTFLSDWQYKHPYPWDMFKTFEEVSGRDLDWFWRSWYYETWTLDHAVADVESGQEESEITIEDRGYVPMPVNLKITTDDGETQERTIDVETWLEGATETSITINDEVTKVEIDPENHFPDVDRNNNTWEK